MWRVEMSSVDPDIQSNPPQHSGDGDVNRHVGRITRFKGGPADDSRIQPIQRRRRCQLGQDQLAPWSQHPCQSVQDRFGSCAGQRLKRQAVVMASGDEVRVSRIPGLDADLFPQGVLGEQFTS